MYHCGMRLIEEKHVPNQVDLMVWSNRLDLIALSNFKGEVQVHRLHWQKVWSLPPPNENDTVGSMAWRPDGKALAIGYSNGAVYIVDIEDKEILNKYVLDQLVVEEFGDHKHLGVTYISWPVRTGTLESSVEYNLYNDSSIFLQKLPSINSTFKGQSSDDPIKDFKEIQEPNQLNMLLVGYGSGQIYLSIFGRFSYGTIILSNITKDECGDYKVLDINLSDDFSVMQVLYQDKTTNNIAASLINTSVLSAYAEEIYLVANRHSQVVQLLSYLDQTMTSITEAWEHILLEMDTKMAYYAASVPEGGVSADLLELLMFGVPSDELELFLLQQLTAKGLKKFGSSVELSYSTIQKLVIKQLNIVSQNLLYHLAELRGLSKVPDRYKILGLEEAMITQGIRACCAFLNKCLELQQVIDVSMRNYKAFFRWLFVVIVRLLDEQTPSEIVKITQQELTHIADFLYNFDNVKVESHENTTEKPVKFNLERLGQYLQDQSLTILPDNEENMWHKFLKENPCITKESDTIFCLDEFKKFSLVQQQKHLKNAVEKIFDVSYKDIGKHFSSLYNIKFNEGLPMEMSEGSFRVTQLFDSSQQRFLAAFIDTVKGCENICFMSVNIMEKSCSATAMKYYFSPNLIEEISQEKQKDEPISILDLQFYSSDYLSVLVNHPHNNESSIYIQIPIKIALDNSIEFNIKSKSCLFGDKILRKNLSPLIDSGVFKVLEKMDGSKIAVSGGRKVAVVLSKSYRKVRVFEMEVEGDDEEDDTFDTTPLSQTKSDQGTPDKHRAKQELIF